MICSDLISRNFNDASVLVQTDDDDNNNVIIILGSQC